MAHNIPNLDAMDDPVALWQIAYTWRNASRDVMATLIGDRRKGYTKIVKTLAGYAANKSIAIRYALKGDTETALLYETMCDQAYDRLPVDLRW